MDSIPRVIEKLDAYIANGENDRAESHLKYWLEESRQTKNFRLELALLNEMMGFYRKNHKREEAVSAAETGICRVESYELHDDGQGIATFVNAATVYKEFGNLEAALENYRKAEEGYLKDDNAYRSVNYASLCNNYASALTEAGNYAEAFERYGKALEILESAGEMKLEKAVTYLNIADMYEAKDGNVNAEKIIDEYLTKAFEILTDSGIPHDAHYRFVMSKCIPAFDYYGQFIRSGELKNIL